MIPYAQETKEARRAHIQRATERARAIVMPGDQLQFVKCGGRSRGRFVGWDGMWMCMAGGRDDVSALSVFKLNGAWVSFADEGYWDKNLGDPRRDRDVLRFDPFFPDETDKTLLSDGFALANRWHDCVICGERIWGGQRIRSRVERINEGKPRVMTFHFCPTCCEAMAASWTDAGEALTARTALGMAKARAEGATP